MSIHIHNSIQSKLLLVVVESTSAVVSFKQLLLYALLACSYCSLAPFAFAFDTNTNNNNNISMNRGAWKSHGRNQRDLVEQLRRANIIRTDAVQTVMERVDRGNYYNHLLAAPADVVDCYADRAMAIGLGQTISAPHMHAYALEEIYPSVSLVLMAQQNQQKQQQQQQQQQQQHQNDGVHILDVGCGSGYLTACFGRWLSTADHDDNVGTNNNNNNINNNNNNKVFGIDIHQGLVDMARRNIQRQDGDLLLAATKNEHEHEHEHGGGGVVTLSLGDGWKGLPEHAPFDAIHVGAAAETLPTTLANQLKVGGVMIIPINNPNDNDYDNGSGGSQILYKIRRIRDSSSCVDTIDDNNKSFYEEDFEITTLLGVRYVPLVHGDRI